MLEDSIVYRYSLAFKQKVVSEIESGKISIEQARKKYDIGGKMTLQKWLKKLGKNGHHHKVVRIEMPEEKDRILALEREKQELEHALAQIQLRLLMNESLLECVEEHYHIDVKKTFGRLVHRKSLPTSKSKS